jgi:hypothetical protein
VSAVRGSHVYNSHPEPTDLTEAEYESLSLSEKMRHHTMCAIEADLRAGQNGHAIGPDELPPRWHINKPIARNHRAEATRLRKLISEARQA